MAEYFDLPDRYPELFVQLPAGRQLSHLTEVSTTG